MELKLSLFFKRRRDSRRIKSIPQGRKRDGKGIERTNNFYFLFKIRRSSRLGQVNLRLLAYKALPLYLMILFYVLT